MTQPTDPPTPAPPLGGSADLEYITPSLANAWLMRNDHNRKPKFDRITRYARDMTSGKWLVTGDAIRFDENGALLDGQNRLMACIQADTGFWSYVVRGLPRSAQVVMDSGVPRTAADALAMRNYVHAKDLAAAVVVHRAWKGGALRNVVSNVPRDRPTHIEVVEYVAEWTELADDVEFAVRQKPHLRGVPIGAIAVAFGEFRRIDPDEALDYFDRIRDGRSTGTGDPILTLVRRVRDETGRGHRMLPSTALFMLFRTWNSIRTGERLVKLQFGSEDRGWTPIPEPK